MSARSNYVRRAPSDQLQGQPFSIKLRKSSIYLCVLFFYHLQIMLLLLKSIIFYISRSHFSRPFGRSKCLGGLGLRPKAVGVPRGCGGQIHPQNFNIAYPLRMVLRILNMYITWGQTPRGLSLQRNKQTYKRRILYVQQMIVGPGPKAGLLSGVDCI